MEISGVFWDEFKVLQNMFETGPAPSAVCNNTFTPGNPVNRLYCSHFNSSYPSALETGYYQVVLDQEVENSLEVQRRFRQLGIEL